MKTLVVGTVAFDAIETPYLKTEKTVGGAATYIISIAIVAFFFAHDFAVSTYLFTAFANAFPTIFNGASGGAAITIISVAIVAFFFAFNFPITTNGFWLARACIKGGELGIRA